MVLKFQSEQKKYLEALNEIRTNLRTWTALYPTKYSMHKNLIRLSCKIVGSYARAFTVFVFCNVFRLELISYLLLAIFIDIEIDNNKNSNSR